MDFKNFHTTLNRYSVNVIFPPILTPALSMVSINALKQCLFDCRLLNKKAICLGVFFIDILIFPLFIATQTNIFAHEVFSHNLHR